MSLLTTLTPSMQNVGSMMNLADSLPSPTSLTYNADGTIATINANGRTLNFSYNTGGNINTITDGSITRTFGYNSNGYINSIT